MAWAQAVAGPIATTSMAIRETRFALARRKLRALYRDFIVKSEILQVMATHVRRFICQDRISDQIK
ncbi:hypothetical protein WK59_13225 [Burkholderia ubonensis]|nr:hypothetical protein WI84_26100 [Burkholderia ubonensis]KVT84419.1 hypothetical protein WK59_13225 [Burkholderia ubonensis]